MREGNHILGVYACESEKPPIAIRYLVDPAVPGAGITVSRNGKKYTVCKQVFIEVFNVMYFCLWRHYDLSFVCLCVCLCVRP